MSNGVQEEDLLRDLRQIVDNPRETLHIEIKGWINLREPRDRANLAQAVLALANSEGGGYIVIGFSEQERQWQEAPGRPEDFESYCYRQDTINEIVRRYADPRFQCDLRCVESTTFAASYPVIRVPGGHSVPIRARKAGPNGAHVVNNAYYIRKPGPESAPCQESSEWDQLISRCVRQNRERLIEDIERIISLTRTETQFTEQSHQVCRLEEWIADSEERYNALVESNTSLVADPLANGSYTVAYMLVDEIEISQQQLRLAMREAEGSETGWPAWWWPERDEIRPRPTDNSIECWIGAASRLGDPGHMDFWRASLRGELYLHRGFEEDATDPGTRFYKTLPIWRIGECLRHAWRFARQVGRPTSDILFRVTWRGLNGRRLVDHPGSRRVLPSGGRAHSDSVTETLRVNAEHIDIELAKHVRRLTRRLYGIFDFFELPEHVYVDELSEMRNRTL